MYLPESAFSDLPSHSSQPTGGASSPPQTPSAYDPRRLNPHDWALLHEAMLEESDSVARRIHKIEPSFYFIRRPYHHLCYALLCWMEEHFSLPDIAWLNTRTYVHRRGMLFICLSRFRDRELSGLILPHWDNIDVSAPPELRTVHHMLTLYDGHGYHCPDSPALGLYIPTDE